MILYGHSAPEWSRNLLSNWTINQTIPALEYRAVSKSVLRMMQNAPETYIITKCTTY